MDDDTRAGSCPKINAFFSRNPIMQPLMPVDCPPGWDAQVARALEELHALASEAGVSVTLVQVKEKLARLTIYVRVDEAGPDARDRNTLLRSCEASGGVRARARNIVDRAAAACATLCQTCGALGRVRHDGAQLSVLCDDHSNDAPPKD